MITVKICRIPGTTQEVALNGDRSVGAALDAAGETLRDGEVAKINNEPAALSQTLTGGEIIVLAKGAKGNC